MKLTSFGQAEAFTTRAASFLLEHEAHHNLIFGICAGLIQHPERMEQPPYVAIVEDGDAVLAATVMTPPHNLVLSLVTVPEALALIAQDVHARYGRLPGVLGTSNVSHAFAEVWQQVSGQSYRKRMAQRIYQLEHVVPVSGVPGELRRATVADRNLLIAWFSAFGRKALGDSDTGSAQRAVDTFLTNETRDIYVWQHGEPVSMAGYSGPTPNGIRVNAVYTPPEQRRKGYASACVAALSQILLDGGRKYCFLFTDASNPTSNHIYQAIGYRAVCEVDEYEFLPRST